MTLVSRYYDERARREGLAGRLPDGNLAVTDAFAASRFGVEFDYGIAQSVFTHLPRSALGRCLDSLRNVFRPGGVLDLFHASRREILAEADRPGWRAEWVGDWGHPRSQRMLRCVRV
jgi:hypothetical protein